MTTLNTSMLKGFGATLIASAAVANLPFVHFVSQIKSSENVWVKSFRDGDNLPEYKILAWTALYLVLHNALKVITGIPYVQKQARRFSRRPSIITSTLHACIMWSVAVFSIVSLAFGYDWVFELWVLHMVPHSIGYYVADVFWYSLPNRDHVVLFHHLLMIFCHYPLTSSTARMLASAGNESWAIWISMSGYACAELAVPILNARWWFIAGEHLKKKGKARLVFTGRMSVGLHVAACIVFFERVVAFSLLLIIEVLPRYNDYVEANEMLAFNAIVVGHVGTLLISALWLWNILNMGYKSISGVMMQIEEEQEPFSYIADVWQGYGLLDHLASEEAGFIMKIDDGKHPEESTVEAKLIMEKAMCKAQRSWLWPVYCMSCFGFSSVGIALYAAHSTLECVDETSLGFILPWKLEAIHFVIQGFLTYQADVAMEFYSCKKTSRWYKADRLSATLLMTYNVAKIFYFLSESGPRQFSVLALAGAVYCYQREHHELQNKSKVQGLYGAMYWHTLWHLLGCCSCYIWLGMTCAF